MENELLLIWEDSAEVLAALERFPQAAVGTPDFPFWAGFSLHYSCYNMIDYLNCHCHQTKNSLRVDISLKMSSKVRLLNMVTPYIQKQYILKGCVEAQIR